MDECCCWLVSLIFPPPSFPPLHLDLVNGLDTEYLLKCGLDREDDERTYSPERRRPWIRESGGDGDGVSRPTC